MGCPIKIGKQSIKKNKFKKKLPVRTVQIEAIKKNENNCIIKSYINFMYKILQNMIN